MRKNSIVLALAAFIVIQICAVALAENSERWFNRKDEGWFWYKSKPIPPEEIPSELLAGIPPVRESNSKPAHQIIKEEGERLLGEAMVNPTEENVKTYMVYNKMMLDGASKFTKVWERVLAQNPELYLSAFYSEDVSTNSQKNVDKLAQEAGIFFFFRSDCPHCHKQVTSLLQLKEKYGFNVLAVSIDGGTIPAIRDITRMDNGISARLGIKAVPALYLGYPDKDKFEPISQGGYLAINDLERRLSHYAQLQEKPQGNYISLPDLSANARAH